MATKFYMKIGSFQTVAWCSVGTSLMGFFLMITGAIITGIAYTELTPPDWDENYQRYKGSDLKRIMGPLLLAAGGFLLFGACGFFVFAFLTDSRREYSPPGTPKLQHKYNTQYNSPSMAAASGVNDYDEEFALERT